MTVAGTSIRYIAFALSLVVAFMTGPVRAEEVRVRAGEHGTFTRLVIDFPGREAWVIGRTADGYAVHTPDRAYAFNTSGVFRMVPRRRVTALAADPDTGTLHLTLGCDCAIEAFEVRGRALVLDVHDRAPVADDPYQVPLAALLAGDDAPIVFDGPVRLLSSGSDSIDENSPPLATTAGPPARAATGPLPGTSLPFPYTAPSPSADALARGLARGLARAAAQGIVDPVDLPQPTGTPTEGLAESGRIRVETALDRAFGAAGDAVQLTLPSDTACIPEADIAVTAWGTEDPAFDQIALRRAALVGEFDRPDPRRVLDYARLLVFLGFGAEAEQVLEEFGIDHGAARTVRALARLIDGRPGTASLLASQIGCTVPGAFWGLMALPPDAGADPGDIDALVQKFLGLPPHLRRHLARRFTERLEAMGATDAATTVAAAVARTAPPGSPERLFLQAGGSEPMVSASELGPLARSTHPDAADALALMMDRLMADGRRVPDDLIDTAAILAEERDGTQGARDLKRLELLARLTHQDLTVAMAAFISALDRETVSEGSAAELTEVAAKRILSKSGDGEFVAVTMTPAFRPVLERMEAELAYQIAERLLEVGLPREALALRRALVFPTEPPAPGFELRALLAAGDFASVAARTEEAVAPEFLSLRAAALAGAGRHSEARAAFEEAGDAARSEDEAWRARDWSRPYGANPERQTARDTLLSAREGAGVPGIATLAEAEARLGESRALRDTLSGLLDSHPPPDS